MKRFYYLFFITFIPFFLSKNLSATTEHDIFKKTDFSVELDRFIKKVVEHLKNDSINYDGKDLVLYSDPSLLSILGDAAGASLFTFLSGACFSFSNKNENLNLAGLIFIPVIIVFIARFIHKLKLLTDKIPVVNIDTEGIKIEGYPKVKWKNILDVSGDHCIGSNKNYFIFLYDKEGKITHKIDSDKNYISVPFSYLIKIIKFCIEENTKTKQKKENINPQKEEVTKNTKLPTTITLEITSPIKQWLAQLKKAWIPKDSET